MLGQKIADRAIGLCLSVLYVLPGPPLCLEKQSPIADHDRAANQARLSPIGASAAAFTICMLTSTPTAREERGLVDLHARNTAAEMQPHLLEHLDGEAPRQYAVAGGLHDAERPLPERLVLDKRPRS